MVFTLVNFRDKSVFEVQVVGVFVFGATAPPPVGQGLLINEVSRSHTMTYSTIVDRTSLDE